MLTERPSRRSGVQMLCACGFLWAACAAAQTSGAPPCSTAPSAPPLEQRVTDLVREVDELKELVRAEFRRDQSNPLYFRGPHLTLPESSRPTPGVGLVWWFGGQEGPW